MSLFTRVVLIFTVLTGALVGQPLTASRAALDASNAEIFARARAQEPRQYGTVSVQQLQQPLEGRGQKMLARAQEYLARGESARGMEQLRAAGREQGAEPWALGMMAVEHIKRGEVSAALVELETAVALEPGIAVNQSNLALVLGVLQRNHEALAHVKKALQLDPAQAKTRYLMGQILLQMGHTEEAAFHLTKAAQEIPAAGALLTRVKQAR